MKYYRCCAETYHNGKLVGAQNGGGRLTEKEMPAKEKFILTWENLSEMYNKLDLLCDFNVWNFFPGEKAQLFVSFFGCRLFDKNTWDIKEWKEELNVEVKVYYLEMNATVEDLKYFDAVQVKKYLDERG